MVTPFSAAQRPHCGRRERSTGPHKGVRNKRPSVTKRAPCGPSDVQSANIPTLNVAQHRGPADKPEAVSAMTFLGG